MSELDTEHRHPPAQEIGNLVRLGGIFRRLDKCTSLYLALQKYHDSEFDPPYWKMTVPSACSGEALEVEFDTEAGLEEVSVEHRQQRRRLLFYYGMQRVRGEIDACLLEIQKIVEAELTEPATT